MALRMEPSPARMTTHREGVTMSGQSAMAAAGQILLSAHSVERARLDEWHHMFVSDELDEVAARLA
jgi:hypothetical protein